MPPLPPRVAGAGGEGEALVSMVPWFEAQYTFFLAADLAFRWVAYSTFIVLLAVIARRLKG